MEYHLIPYKHLTVELIDKLHIHHTVSELRRSLERSPWIEKVDETEYVPTLYYRKGDEDPDHNDWTVHALCKDLHRFTLKKLIDEPEPELQYTSSIDWDGRNGKVDGCQLITYKDGGILIFDGTIAWNRRAHANTVGVVLTMNKDTYDKLKDTIKIEYLNRIYDHPKSNVLCFLVPFRVPGQEIPLTLIWDENHKQSYTICVTNESILLRY